MRIADYPHSTPRKFLEEDELSAKLHEMSAGSIIESVLDPFTESLTPQAARKTLDFHVDAETQARVSELAELASSGKITDAERREYRELVEACDLVAILKSRARQVISAVG